VIIIMLSVLSAIFEAGVIYCLSRFDDLVAEIGLENLIYGLIAISVTSMASRVITLWFTNNSVLRFTSAINRELYGLGCLKSFNGRYKISDSISLAEKCQIIGTSVLVPVFNAISALIIAMALVLALIYTYGKLTLISLGLILAFYVIIIFLIKGHLRSNSKLLANYQSNRAGLISDSLAGSHEIFAYHKREITNDIFGSNEAIFVDSASKVLFFGAVPRFIIESILVVLLMVVVYFSSSNDDAISISDLLAFGFGGIRLVPLFQQVYNGWARLRSNFQSVREVVNFVETNIDVVDSQNIPNFSIVNDDYLFTWDTLPNYVRYSESTLRLAFKKNKTTLLQGPSGSGKSTLVNSLIRSAYLNNVNIGVVTPYNSRFGLTIKDYFKFFDIKIDSILKHYLTKFRLITDRDFELFLALGMSKLSTGEFQRVQFARDIIKKPNLLIIDESFSNIDGDMVDIVLKELKNLNDTRVLVISHFHLDIDNIFDTVRLN